MQIFKSVFSNLLIASFIVISMGTSAIESKDAWKKLAGAKQSERPEFSYLTNNPSLSNVLIYGDSISIGYTQRVREQLQNQANVYRLYRNGGESASFIKKMTTMHKAMQSEKLSQPWDFQWDVIHFNVGLHDLKYVLNGKLDKKNGKQVASLTRYKQNLHAIVAYLKELAPKAKLIFATTTPVPENADGRNAGDAKKYNQAALSVIKQYPSIIINDLYSFTKPVQQQWWIKSGDVHYNKTGTDAQGDQVADVIKSALVTLADNLDGFTTLFNGKNWDGWYLKLRSGDAEMAKKVFAIENNEIHVFNDAFPDNYKLNTGENDTHGLFYTNKKYTHYILKFDYKWGPKKANNFKQWQYDAGVYYHVTKDEVWPFGIEYQLRYNHLNDRNHSGDLIIPRGAKATWYSTTDPDAFESKKDSGRTYLHPEEGGKIEEPDFWLKLAKPTKNFHGLDNQWNQVEIIVMGGEYAIHKLNGDVVNMATDLFPMSGVIGFQAETSEIFYRNIKIKEFEKSLPAEQFL